MYIVIVGGGKIGKNLANNLTQDGNNVAIIELDSLKCEDLASSLNTLVINGDGAEYSVLESAETTNADFVVAVTGNDEVNFVICELAKISFKVKKTITRVNDSRNESIFKKLGVDFVFTSSYLVSKMMQEAIKSEDSGLPFVLASFLDKKSKFEIDRFIVKQNSPSFKKHIEEIKLPREALIIALLRNNEITIPYGDTIIEDGDILYVVLKKDLINQVKHILVNNS
jgi:trk system potassium uptake protein